VTPLRRAAPELDHLRAVAQARAQARAQIDAAAVGIGREAPRADLRDRQSQIGEHLLAWEISSAVMVSKSACCSTSREEKERLASSCVSCGGSTGVSCGFFGFGAAPRRPATRPLVRHGLAAVDLREEHRHDALEELRIAPENVERLM